LSFDKVKREGSEQLVANMIDICIRLQEAANHIQGKIKYFNVIG
jgi:hypothetical protein